MQIQRGAAICLVALFVCVSLAAQTDSTHLGRKRFVQSIGTEFRGGWVLPTNNALKGPVLLQDGTSSSTQALRFSPIKGILSCHLRYALRFAPHTPESKTFLNAYQGIGLAGFHILHSEQEVQGNALKIGSPLVVYLFQGGELARFSSRLALEYEWNFGASFGWTPYDKEKNAYNMVIGSKVNAYLNLGLNLRYALSPHFSLTAGASATHFSNGNTRYPNAGLNTAEGRIGLTYNFGQAIHEENAQAALPPFRRHWCYDLTLFGSWRRRIVNVYYGQAAAPGTYGVAGFSFAPLYCFGHKFRAGISLDGIYDHSANVVAEELPTAIGDDKASYEYHSPTADKQLGLGLSARGEFVMPFFTIAAGLGGNFLGHGDLKCLYQMLSLKIDVTKSGYLNIGYNLRNFKDPNYLMLGLGYRFGK